MITLENISKNYHASAVPALRNINLDIARGEIYGIIGKSGAGKSTLIRCVNLLERPTTGRVLVGGNELTAMTGNQLRHARREIGMIFQHFNLLASRTVFDNVAFSLELAGFSREKIKNTVMPLLELTGLLDKKNSYPSQLSGGQKQRVAIARAIACQPKVLLSDEATSALDPETTMMILELLKNIRDQLQLTILLITHEMSVIKACCDRVGVLHAGELVEENEIGEFFTHPQTAIAKSFIQSSLPQAMPLALEKHLSLHESETTYPVLRLWFLSDTANQPLISQLARDYGVQINILQANVEYIKNHAMGIMLIAAFGDKKNITASIEFLKKLGVHVEVMGYVPDNVAPFI